jgi:multisubunit Na+/H+ antiporter MnhE subunit
MFKNYKMMDHVWLIFLFTAIYIVLNETLSWLTVGLGVVSGIVAIFLTNKILEIDYVEMFHINLWLVLTYFWIIIRDTYVMGFNTIIRIFKGDIKPNYINYRSDLNDEFLTILLANAITMPPGAIAVERAGDEMTILTVGIETDEFKQLTKDKIERLLAKFDSNRED